MSITLPAIQSSRPAALNGAPAASTPTREPAGAVGRELLEVRMNTDKIKSPLAKCEAAARAEGYDGEDFEPTAPDMEWVCERLGYKPTAEEWQAAGLSWVGGDHTEVQS